MATQVETPREILLVEPARIRPMMGVEVLESVPLPRIPYRLVDPFILFHKAVLEISETPIFNARYVD